MALLGVVAVTLATIVVGAHPPPSHFCTRIYMPVCASNHRTYSNPCMFQKAADAITGLYMLHTGECHTNLDGLVDIDDEINRQTTRYYDYDPMPDADSGYYSGDDEEYDYSEPNSGYEYSEPKSVAKVYDSYDKVDYEFTDYKGDSNENGYDIVGPHSRAFSITANKLFLILIVCIPFLI